MKLLILFTILISVKVMIIIFTNSMLKKITKNNSFFKREYDIWSENPFNKDYNLFSNLAITLLVFSLGVVVDVICFLILLS